MTTNTHRIVFPCFEIEQPIGTFYLGVLDSHDLLAISYADVRRLDKRDVEQYLGIQRPLDRKRVSELHQYVTTVDAAFPGNILLAVSSADATYDPITNVMSLPRDGQVARILDGQHRIAGLEGATGTFQSAVAIFVDMDIEDQANIFATINLKQTKVNRSLAYDLFEFAKSRSPQKTAHNIAKLLNTEEGSPFEGKIKLLGVASMPNSEETLTQALVVDQLLKLITSNEMKDRDVLRRGESLDLVNVDELQTRPFRNLFITNQDAIIARNVWNLFIAVDRRWPNAWRYVTRGMILNRTTGFTALMRFLGIMYSREGRDSVLEVDTYLEVLRRVQVEERDLNRDKYVPGSSGIRDLSLALTEALDKR